METLKVILLIVLGLVVLLAIVAMFLKKKYSVEREVIINKSVADVFKYVKLLKNQENYAVWSKRDVNVRRDFKGTDATVGFTSSWSSDVKEVGVGEQEIKNIVANKRIDTELRFMKPMKAVCQAYIATESAGTNKAKVKWGFSGKMCYPMNLMLACTKMEKMMGKDLEDGLLNLKMILEKEHKTEKEE